MSTHGTQYLAVSSLIRIATAMRAGGRGLRTAAKRLDALLDKRRVAAAAMRDLAGMSERELLDIGLTKVDVYRVARGESNPRPR